MWALIKLQAKTMIKNPASLFMLIMPLIFVSIMGTSMAENDQAYTQIIGNVITMNLIAVTMMTFGYTLFEMKKSIIMKRIGSTQITKTRAMMAFFAWTSVVGTFTIVWTMIVAQIFASAGATPNFLWGSIHWGSFFYALVVGTILSLAIGFFFVSISPNLEVFNMAASMYMMLNMFLGGLFLPGTADWMRYVSYALPHTFVGGLMKTAFSGESVFALNGAITTMMKSFDNIGTMTLLEFSGLEQSENIIHLGTFVPLPLEDGGGFALSVTKVESLPKVLYSQADTIANFVVPIISIGAIIGISTKTFKWDA